MKLGRDCVTLKEESPHKSDERLYFDSNNSRGDFDVNVINILY